MCVSELCVCVCCVCVYVHLWVWVCVFALANQGLRKCKIPDFASPVVHLTVNAKIC